MDNRTTLRDWSKTLLAEGKSARTVQSYAESAEQLAAFLDGADVLSASRDDLRGFMAHLLATRAPSTAAVRFRSLQQLYKWAIGEDLLTVSPMAGMTPPAVPEQPVPVVGETELRKLLDACDGKGFTERRDQAMFRLMLEPGGLRRAEVAGLRVADVDLDQDVVVILGKGSRWRSVPFGFKTSRALTRYLRVRIEHPWARRTDALWLAQKGRLTDSGMAQALERRCAQAGIPRLHPHQLRHTAAHVWKAAGGSEDDMMRLFGWRSRQMVARYGSSVADERAQAAARRMALGDRL